MNCFFGLFIWTGSTKCFCVCELLLWASSVDCFYGLFLLTVSIDCFC